MIRVSCQGAGAHVLQPPQQALLQRKAGLLQAEKLAAVLQLQERGGPCWPDHAQRVHCLELGQQYCHLAAESLIGRPLEPSRHPC